MMEAFTCCYCERRIASEADLIGSCDLAPGGWHREEPLVLDEWAPAIGRWAQWD